jgi:hypothetical protein
MAQPVSQPAVYANGLNTLIWITESWYAVYHGKRAMYLKNDSLLCSKFNFNEEGLDLSKNVVSSYGGAVISLF